MIYTPSPLAVSIFLSFVALVLGISFYFARRTSDSKSYFAAGGSIHWGVNGIAFAGDYLSQLERGFNCQIRRNRQRF